MIHVPDRLWKTMLEELALKKELVRLDSDWGPNPLVCQGCGAWGKHKPARDRDGEDTQYRDFNLVDHHDDCRLVKLFKGIKKVTSSVKSAYDKARAVAFEEARKEFKAWTETEDVQPYQFMNHLRALAAIPPTLVVVKREALEKVKKTVADVMAFEVEGYEPDQEMHVALDILSEALR